MVDDLKAVVELETHSYDKAMLVRGLREIRARTVGHLGTPDDEILHEGGGHGDILELYYRGTAPGVVLLLCHYDTVWPTGTLAGWPFAVLDGKATGPGVFDMKTGLVQAVWALRGLRELGLPHPGVRFLFNGDEEIGSPASREYIESASEGALATLVFEASMDGALKTARKGVGLFNVTVTGVEAHAGLDPYAGASAVHALAELVTTLAGAGSRERGTTVNVGLISGGTGRNVTAGRATCGVDVRVTDPAEMGRIDDVFAALRVADPRVKISVTGEWNRPPMVPNPASQRLFKEVQEVAAGFGWLVDEAAVGGASDGNFVSALGRPVLDGMGAVGDGAHARHEHVVIEHIPERTALTMGLITALA
ncbi:M20 family metallopeptidase [Nonomuraea sp. FMUSA5-5]|uniref:M20 family metallopeptidase n=2 Tax=Nonomuraea composti TaxID=2720023 RepID=A0ABX1BDG3_9ACTN|nr:M20 family metallopeptidase [Nonomuraea sp. FMUSA5-5]NJP94439.1 M20 family metallopeptidase [Nonomuraea sp. FMUSA5-5]